MTYRFYPLSEHPDCGIFVRDGSEPFVAEFLTPKQAKSRVLRRQRKEELALLAVLQGEAQMRSALA